MTQTAVTNNAGQLVAEKDSDGESMDSNVKSRKKKSGIVAMPTDNIKTSQVWPHYNLSFRFVTLTVQFHKLSWETKTILTASDPLEIKGRVTLMSRLAYLKHRGHTWSNLHTLYTAIVSHIEKQYGCPTGGSLRTWYWMQQSESQVRKVWGNHLYIILDKNSGIVVITIDLKASQGSRLTKQPYMVGEAWLCTFVLTATSMVGRCRTIQKWSSAALIMSDKVPYKVMKQKGGKKGRIAVVLNVINNMGVLQQAKESFIQ